MSGASEKTWKISCTNRFFLTEMAKIIRDRSWKFIEMKCRCTRGINFVSVLLYGIVLQLEAAMTGAHFMGYWNTYIRHKFVVEMRKLARWVEREWDDDTHRNSELFTSDKIDTRKFRSCRTPFWLTQMSTKIEGWNR